MPITDASHDAAGRRSAERRKAKPDDLIFPDRRQADRRSGDDRRDQPRIDD